MKRSELKYNQCTAHDSTDWTRITWVLERKEGGGGGRVGAKNSRATLINLQNKHSSTESSTQEAAKQTSIDVTSVSSDMHEAGARTTQNSTEAESCKC